MKIITILLLLLLLFFGFGFATSSGRPGDSGAVEVAPSPAAEGYAHPEWLVDPGSLQGLAAGPDVKVIALTPARDFAAGHIPGATNVQFTENAAATDPKRWKSAGELRAMYADLGVTPERLVIPYCSTGVRSAATYFTLRLIGYEDVSLFTGSWKEWSRHPELPVTTGERP
ncbi:MAG: sulfurtransferase [Thermomicrobiales bacterium]